LVLQNDTGNQHPRFPNTIVLAMSSSGRPIPFHVRLEPTPENGLRATTYVKCEQILTVSKGRLLGNEPLGKVTPIQMRQVEIAVLLSLGIAR